MCEKKNYVYLWINMKHLQGVHDEPRVETGGLGYSVISIYFTPARNNASLSASVIHLAGVSSLILRKFIQLLVII
jgi:hypothetical protein